MPFAKHKNKVSDYSRADELRQQSSKVEQKMWYALRNLPKGLNLKFRRQHPISPYVADFVCLKRKLVIELDGDSHDDAEEYDKRRNDYMRRLGYRVLRCSNDDVMKNVEGVVLTILREAGENPSPLAGEDRKR